MLLTDALIDDIHAFRVGMMANSRPIHDCKAMCGGYARFAGDGSPLSQMYGIGHRDAPIDLDELEAFYSGRAENWEVIVTTFAPASVLRELTAFGYVPDHFETVMGQIAPSVESEMHPEIQIEEVKGDLTLWQRVSDAGWSGQDDLADEPSEIARLMAADPAVRRYLAYSNGEPAAAAGLLEWEGRFLFAGACTRPQFRGQGLQRALTQRRLRDAGEGSFVQVVTFPGSQSHRNAQRSGFQPLYSKLVLFRHAPD